MWQRACGYRGVVHRFPEIEGVRVEACGARSVVFCSSDPSPSRGHRPRTGARQVERSCCRTAPTSSCKLESVSVVFPSCAREFGAMASDGYKPWWAIDKAAWREVLAPFYKFASISDRRDTPLPPWSEADVQAFIASDPVYGPQLKLVRQGATIANVGAVAGGLATAGLSFKYSKNLPGAVLGFLGGAAMSWAVAEEGANFGLGLYKFNCMDANLKFLDWWERKQK